MYDVSGKIDIVLATYNGEKYLSEQLNSILAMHSFDEIINKIIVCDDNSTDHTLDIIARTIPPNKLILVKSDQGKPYGPAKNFERGIRLANSEFIMLSDQDDIWMPNKIIAYIKEAEKCNKNLPLLIFSDLEVVDSDLRLVDKSFLHYQSIKESWVNNINNLLIQNLSPGCTMMFNQKLIQKSFPLPDKCLMHDWWLIVVCKIYGEIRFISNETFIKYRQHANNQVGAKSNSFLNAFFNFKKSFYSASRNYERTIQQMLDIKLRYLNDLSDESLAYIDALSLYVDAKSSKIKRVYAALKVNLKKSSSLKTVGTYLIIFKGIGK
ncbi:glycosyltransferase family 2 protein [Erwinia oleae]|uniref:glycosyltransferase family 2 protein n=1 Tax=Erwinia oleae TaxID=796334 RepID=UPI0005571D73|nr:glycosyltransferase family 2 protein [Erwinia oleae]